MGSARPGRTAVRHMVAFVLIAALAPSVSAQSQAPNAGVTATRDGSVGGDTTRTRFVIGLEKAVEFQVSSLQNNRVVIDMPEVKLQLPTTTGAAPVGLVKSFFGGQSAPGKTRVVIDTTAPVVVETSKIEASRDGRPPRLVLEIVPVDARAQAARKGQIAPPQALGAAGVTPPAPKAAQRPKPRDTATMYKPLIVIDPGHGGHDSGAIKHGAVEKEVVLAFSLKLRDKLEASGRYKVLMTRDTDKFVPLDERRAFGDNAKAALFIAVHADYAGSGARGATIYSLKDATNQSLQRSAKQEVAENVLSQKELDGVKRSQGDVGAVTNILQSLAQREVAATKDRTEAFSKSVISFMSTSTPMQSNPDREANFRVLKSAKVPSVLIELAYVTNAQDARNLRSDSWRENVADSLMTAINNYFTNQVAQLPY